MKDAVHVNSIGYFPDQAKAASVLGGYREGEVFEVIDGDGKGVFSGGLTAAPDHPDMEIPVFHADFSAFAAEGVYRIRMKNTGAVSACFSIGSGIYNKSLELCMKGFYGQRCGTAVSFEHNGRLFEKKPCHMEDGYLDYYDPSKKGEIKDACGGWHDAGDYGKYVVNAAFATGHMLSAWEQFGSKLESLTLPIPESGGPVPDFLAEIKYNMDWILKMQFEDGLVSHKLTRTAFAPMVMPSNDREKRFFSPWGYDATASFAAVASQAYRVFGKYDGAYAGRCLDAAGRAMAALRNVPFGARPDQSAFNTGRYDRYRHTDIEWALFEYWESTGDEEALRNIEFGLHNENFHVDVDWDWGLSKNMGIYTFLRSKRKRNPSLVKELEYDLIAAADRIVDNSRTHTFGRGLKRYYWGCNGSVARTAMSLCTAGEITGEPVYRETALAQLSYLYGNNPYGRSFVTGDGHDPPLFPHHRPSAADNIEDPWPGHLVGGPHPTELDWNDATEDPRTNENAINWDGALVFALSAFYEG